MISVIRNTEGKSGKENVGVDQVQSQGKDL